MLANNMPSFQKVRNTIRQLTIGTHDGKFHCDEVVACAILKYIYPNSKIIRTRISEVLENCDILVDVGCIFDVKKRRFDHHQSDFNDTFHSLDKSKNSSQFNIRLSSAGLIWYYYGKMFLNRKLSEIFKNNLEDELLTVLYYKFYKIFIKEIDAIDNGIKMFSHNPSTLPTYDINTNISYRVNLFNPGWNETRIDSDIHFMKAVEYVTNEIFMIIDYEIDVWWPAKQIVMKAVDNLQEIDESCSILLLDHGCPWKNHLVEMVKDGDKVLKNIKYVVFEADQNGWRVQTVNNGILPRKWLQMNSKDFESEYNIHGFLFLHSNLFIIGIKDKENAIKMAKLALNLSS